MAARLERTAKRTVNCIEFSAWRKSFTTTRRHQSARQVLPEKLDPTRYVMHCYAKNTSSWREIFIRSTSEEFDHPSLVFIKSVLADEQNRAKVGTRNTPESDRKLVNQLRYNHPQPFGLSGETVKARFNFLVDVGVSSDDAISIAMRFPSALFLETENAGNVIKALLSSDIDIARAVNGAPLLLATDHVTIQKNLDILSEIDFRQNTLKDLILSDPLVLAFGLNEDAISVLKTATVGKSSSCHLELLKRSFDMRSVRSSADAAYNSNCAIMETLGISPTFLARRGMPVLLLGDKKLHQTISFLMNKPLYLGIPDIKDLFLANPTVFFKFCCGHGARTLLVELESIFSDNTVLHRAFMRFPFLFLEELLATERIHLLRKFGFSNKDIGRLIWNCIPLFTNNKLMSDVESKLVYLLNPRDVKLSDIVGCPTVLRYPLSALQCRIGFARHVSDDLIGLPLLSKKFFVDDKEFVEEFCSSSLKEYSEYIITNNLQHYNFKQA